MAYSKRYNGGNPLSTPTLAGEPASRPPDFTSRDDATSLRARRKEKTTRLAYNPMADGVQKIIEGFNPSDFTLKEYGDGTTDRKMRSHNRDVYERLAIFHESQKLREQTISLPDPQAEISKLRKEAARARMRGYLGTILSKRI